MPGPIIFISHRRVREGKLEVFEQQYPQALKGFQADMPGTLMQLAYLSEDGSEVTVVQLIADADAMDNFMQSADDRAKWMKEFTTPGRIELYGTPNKGVLEAIGKLAGSGIPVSFNPVHLGGFHRFTVI